MSNLKPNIVNVSHLTMAESMAMENEGFTEKPYHDTVNKLTIGYGRNLEDRGITWDEAKMLLAHDLMEAHNVLHGEFDFFRRLSDPRKAVLMDMYHNMGMRRLMSFKKMLKAVQFNDFDEAAAQIEDSRYFVQVGRRARRNYFMMKFNRFAEVSDSENYFHDKKK